MNTSNLATKLPKAASSYMLQVVDKYDIKNPLHLAHFLAQIAHESGNFQFVTENLNYLSPKECHLSFLLIMECYL